MNRFVVIALVFSSFSPFATAEEWHKTFHLTGRPELRVESSDASITVDTWNNPGIEAQVTTYKWKIAEDGVKIYDRQNGDVVELEVRLPHRSFTFDVGSSRRVEIRIHMPREGKLDVRTGDGQVTVRDIKGDVQISSGDGRLELDRLDGALRARTGDGHITADGRSDKLDLNTGDGHVTVRAEAGSQISSSWSIRSGDGPVTLDLPSNLAADVDLHTNDGHIDLDIPVAVEGKFSQNNLRGKMNGGGNTLVIHTGDGSIRLARAM